MKVVDQFLLLHRDVIRGEGGTLGVLGNHLLLSWLRPWTIRTYIYIGIRENGLSPAALMAFGASLLIGALGMFLCRGEGSQWLCLGQVLGQAQLIQALR